VLAVPGLALAAYAAFAPLSPASKVIWGLAAVNVLLLTASLVAQPALLPGRKQAVATKVSHELLRRGLDVVEPSDVADLAADILREHGIASRLVVALEHEPQKIFLHGGDEQDGAIVSAWGGSLVSGSGRVPNGAPAAPSLDELCPRLGCNVVLPLERSGARFGVVFVAARSSWLQVHSLWLETASYLSFLLQNRPVVGAVKAVPGSLELATSLQHGLMPPARVTCIPAVDCYGTIRLTPHGGGDVWTAHPLGSDKLLVFVGDVTGHGPGAAVLSVAVKGTVDAVAMLDGVRLGLEALFREVDLVVRSVGNEQCIMSAVATVVDMTERSITFANAGHPWPVLVSRDEAGATARQIDVGTGGLLGTDDFAVEARTFPLVRGAKYVLYTDGIPEAAREDRICFGNRRLGEALVATAGERPEKVAESLLARVDEFVRGRQLSDDVTVVVVETKAGAEATPA
jgi:hypothetical protein